MWNQGGRDALSAATGTEDPGMQLSMQGRKRRLQTSVIYFHDLLLMK